MLYQIQVFYSANTQIHKQVSQRQGNSMKDNEEKIQEQLKADGRFDIAYYNLTYLKDKFLLFR